MDADVNGKTRVYGIIGHPVSHSRSPAMQNAALRAAGIDAVYVPFPVEPERFAGVFAALPAAGVAGINITVPFKEAAARLVDTLTPEAERAGAVNVVAWRNGRAEGHNTDGLGFVRAAERLAGRLKGRRVLILGAGGAARGIAAALAGAQADVWIANRTQERAGALHHDLRLAGTVPGWSPQALGAAASVAHLVVNASSAGMHGEGDIPLDFQALGAKPAVIDLVYAPLETGFLKRAAAAGCPVQDGLCMLAAQGEIAFEFWHGRPAPAGVMEAAARRTPTPPLDIQSGGA